MNNPEHLTYSIDKNKLRIGAALGVIVITAGFALGSVMHTSSSSANEPAAPITDDTAHMLDNDPPEPTGDLADYRAAMAARSEKLSLRRSEIDPICDPATDGLIAEVVRSMSDLIDEAAQVGV
ncbi:MAG: hypothetical protein EBY49_01330 [Actinobacteria bacterium]|nr:hypothetical protein [Actinomycetota bacterium]